MYVSDKCQNFVSPSYMTNEYSSTNRRAHKRAHEVHKKHQDEVSVYSSKYN